MRSPNAVKKLMLSVLCGVMLFGSFFGVSHMGIDMSMNDGQKFHCPLMPGVVICNMTQLQHMAAAQNAFTAIPQIDVASLLLMLLAAVLASLIVTKVVASSALQLRPVSIFTVAPVPAYRPLQEAFSNGILHPRAF